MGEYSGVRESDTISLRVPSDAEPSRLAEELSRSAARLAGLVDADADALSSATAKLVAYAAEQAYPGDAEGEIAVELHPHESGVRVDVHDWGLPFELSRHRGAGGAAPPAGLEEVASLVDDLEFHNLGRDGKMFTLVKHASHGAPAAPEAPLLHDEEPAEPREELRERVEVRDFEPGDEEGISRLVYRNYSYSYKSDLFYFPEKVLEQNREGRILSTVAALDDRVVGHHSLTRLPDSNVAETGVAVVDPKCKGMGVFSRMYTHTLERAERIGLDAVCAQAVTFHPYSQKAELAHGYSETALLLGKVSGRVRIEHNELSEEGRRGASIVVFKPLKSSERAIFLPSAYAEQVERTYAHGSLEFGVREAPAGDERGISYEFDPGLELGTIRISGFANGDERRLRSALHYLLAKHADMVYADVDLESVENLDQVVSALNAEGFFYAGVLFLHRFGRDHLRLQLVNSLNVEEQQIVCYSDFAKGLLDFVREDQQRVVQG